MKRLYLPLAAVVAACSIVYAVVAAPLIASNPPLALTPGTDQPLTCTTTLVGTLADPACATAIPPTATPVPATATPATATSLLAPGAQLYVGCADGSIPSDFGTRFVGGHFQVFLTCPASTPTP